MDADLEAMVRQLILRGEKIEAIKRVRERTGMGLVQAKAAVEALENNKPTQQLELSDAEIEAKIRSLVQHGKAIEAIKLVRERTGWGLKESKEYVDIFLREYQQTLHESQRKNPYLPQISLNAVLGVVAVVLIVLIFWLRKTP